MNVVDNILGSEKKYANKYSKTSQKFKYIDDGGKRWKSVPEKYPCHWTENMTGDVRLSSLSNEYSTLLKKGDKCRVCGKIVGVEDY